MSYVQEISLESAYEKWIAGKIDSKEAKRLAANLECECGNGGVTCWWSIHQDMRNAMLAAREADNTEEIALTCANCGKHLNQKQCKLVCECGYFASCSDYY